MQHDCGTRDPERVVASDSGGRKHRVVDIHCHWQCLDVGERMQAEAERLGHGALSFGLDLPQLTKETNARQLQDIRPKMTSVDVRLADMDAMGVDVQAISVPPFQFYYWAEPEVARDAARDMNDQMAAIVGAHPERFVALNT